MTESSKTCFKCGREFLVGTPRPSAEGPRPLCLACHFRQQAEKYGTVFKEEQND